MSSSPLDELVTAVASRLMAVNAVTVRAAAEAVLRDLVDYFMVDVSFLRFHDLERRTTSLVAEWPRRPMVPDPDPLGEIFFASADPVIAASEHLTEVMIIRPGPESRDCQRWIQEGSGIEATSAATVPLRSGDVTTGILGFLKWAIHFTAISALSQSRRSAARQGRSWGGWARLLGRDRGPARPGGLIAFGRGLATSCR